MSVQMTYPPNLTWDEFLALPEEIRHADLIDGEVVVNPPSSHHGRIVGNLFFALHRWTEEGPLRGEVTFEFPIRISSHRGYSADIAWFPAAQCAPADEPAAFVGLPSLVGEVLSPSTRARDLNLKRPDYERLGIAELWIVDPKKQNVRAFRRHTTGGAFQETQLSSDDELTSPMFPGLSLHVFTLFRYGRPDLRF